MSYDSEERSAGHQLDAEEGRIMSALTVRPDQDHFPLCVVWMPLPVLTWILPFVGHAGIATSRGTIHDFVGSHMINKHPHKMGFGRVTKYWQIRLKDIKSTSFLHAIARAAQEAGEAERLMPDGIDRSIEESEEDTLIRAWDESIELASGKYRHENHNLLANNCHDHVSESLRRINFKGTTRWNTVTLTLYLMLYGEFVSFRRMLATWLPFFIILGLIILISVLIKFA